jgi:hypothetical protein
METFFEERDLDENGMPRELIDNALSPRFVGRNRA